jgi:hypothetical protein
MYQRDVPKILSYVKEKGPDGLVDVGSFVLSTIRVPFSRTANMVAEVKECGEKATCLWGFKRGGYRHLQDNRVPLYQKLVEAPVGRSEALLEVSKTPGLGLVKAGFLLQCLGYETACMDSHNVKRYGLDPKTVQSKGKITEEKVYTYLNLCDKLGSSEAHWSSWCEYVAGNRYNRVLTTADRVSAFHYEAIAA